MMDIRIRFDATLRIMRANYDCRRRLFQCLLSHRRFYVSTPNITPSHFQNATNESRLERLCFDLERRRALHDTHPKSLSTERFRQLRSIADVLYAGFDPTADSLHIGNLLILIVLLRASLFGCKSIALVGGVTALIGDPSGQANDRRTLSTDVVRNNVDSIETQISNISTNFQQMIHDRSVPSPLLIINNSAWYSQMLMIDFLQMSRSFRVGEMLRRRVMRERLEESGINFAEFSYQILQSYDWLQLNRAYGCCLQIGGADQLGNFDAGYDFIKANSPAFGVSLPLVTDSFGRKMSKSNGNPIWLNEQRTSSYVFYQHFRQRTDAEMPSLLRLFSLKPIEEVEQVIVEHERDPGRWFAQTRLADEMTELVHGRDRLESAHRCSRLLFNSTDDENAFRDVNANEIESAIGVASTFHLSTSTTTTIGQLADAVPPSSPSHRGSTMMTHGALKINGRKMIDPDEKVVYESICLPHSRITLVCWGKRKYYLVKWID